jgi:hypothetical protein
VVALAADRYRKVAPGEAVDPAEVGRAAGQKPELVDRAFPTPGDLADSVLRRLVGETGAPAGTGDWDVHDPAPWIRSILRTLGLAARSHPAVVAATRRHPPTYPSEATHFIAELTQTITGLLDSSETLRCDEPHEDAHLLVDLALQGETGWQGAMRILELRRTAPT